MDYTLVGFLVSDLTRDENADRWVKCSEMCALHGAGKREVGEERQWKGNFRIISQYLDFQGKKCYIENVEKNSSPI